MPVPVPECEQVAPDLVQIRVGNATVSVEANGTARFQAGSYGSLWRVQVQPSGAPAVMKVVLTRARHKNNTSVSGHGTPAEKEVAMGQRLLRLQAHRDAAPPRCAWWRLPWLWRHRPSSSDGAGAAAPQPELSMLQHTVRVLAVGKLSGTDINAMRTWPLAANETATAVVMAPLAYTVLDRYEQQGRISGAEWQEIMSGAARANVAYLKAGLVYTDSKTRNLMRDASTGTWKYVDIGSFEAFDIWGLNNTLTSLRKSTELPTNVVWAGKERGKIEMTHVPPRILHMAHRAAAALRHAAAASLHQNAGESFSADLQAARAAACAAAYVVDKAAATQECSEWPAALQLAAAAATNVASAAPAPVPAQRDCSVLAELDGTECGQQGGRPPSPPLPPPPPAP